MKYPSFFAVLIASLTTGCTLHFDEDYMNANHQNTEKDSITVYQNDNSYSKNATAQDTPSYKECYLTVQSYILIDGQTIPTPSTLRVTVSEIVISVVKNKGDTITYSPEPVTEIKESISSGWNNIPGGLSNVPTILYDEPIYFVYDNSYEVNVTIYYVVRVKDDNLAEGYSIHYEKMTVRHSSTAGTDKVDAPVKLTSVKFDATVM